MTAPLRKISGFVPLIAMIILNAFIDLGHKITVQNTIFKLYDGSEQVMLTAIVNAFILLPYIMLFRPAGRASDKYSKTTVLRGTAVSVLFITLAALVCYINGWFWAAFFLTFILAIQSAYYGPAKYGLLKELVSNEQLTRANGIAQGLTTVSILVSILFFSVLFEWRYDTDLAINNNSVLAMMTPLALLLVAMAVAECWLAWKLPVIAPDKTGPDGTIKELKRFLQRPPLLPVVTGLAVFWSTGQMIVAVYPAFAKDAMGIENTVIVQGLLAMMAVGIMLGSLVAGQASRHFIELRLLPLTALAVVLISLVLPLNTSPLLAALLFLALGTAGGLLVVPLNAVVQFCTPREKLGITIANLNLVQNIAMISCLAFTVTASWYAVAADKLLYLIAVIAAAGLFLMLAKLPQARIAMFNPHVPEVEGFDYIRGHGPILFVSNDMQADTVQALRHSFPRFISHELPQQWQISSCTVISEADFASAGIPDHVNVYHVRREDNNNGIHLTFVPA